MGFCHLLYIEGNRKSGSQTGSTSENWRSEDETQHTLTVSDFYMSVYELTQAEYQEIMEENPSTFSGSDLPVENVTWLDALRYCNARSEKEVALKAAVKA